LLDLLANRVPALVRAARSGVARHGEAAALDLCLALGDRRTAFLPDLRRGGVEMLLGGWTGEAFVETSSDEMIFFVRISA
jgi:hypothetical protein